MVKKKGGLGRGLGALGLGGATVNKPAKSQENKKEQQPPFPCMSD